MSKILQNAVKIIEGDEVSYLQSFRRHDYVVHTFKDGSTLVLDDGCKGGGGGDYFRSNGPLTRPGKCESWFLNEDSSFEDCCKRLLWGSRGRDGKSPLKYAPFSELELDHLKNILKYNCLLAVGMSDLQIKVINHWINIKENTNKP